MNSKFTLSALLALLIIVTALGDKQSDVGSILIGNLKDINSSVRAHAAFAVALGESNDSRAIDPLIQALNDSNGSVRAYAALALGKVRATKAVEPLIKTLSDKDNKLRVNAAWALGQINDTRSVEPLIKSLKDNDSAVRANAAAALGNSKNDYAIEPLIESLKDNDSNVRANAAWALGKIGDNRIIALSHVLNDKDAHVRDKAVEALKKLEWLNERKGVATFDAILFKGDAIKIAGYTFELVAVQSVRDGLVVIRVIMPSGMSQERALIANNVNSFDGEPEKGGITLTVVGIQNNNLQQFV